MTLAALLFLAAALVAGPMYGFAALGYVFLWIGVVCGLCIVVRGTDVDRVAP